MVDRSSYFEFVLVLLFSTGLSFQVPVIQLLRVCRVEVVGADAARIWRYVVVEGALAAAVRWRAREHGSVR